MSSAGHLDFAMALVLHVCERVTSGECLPGGPHLAPLRRELLDKLEQAISSIPDRTSDSPRSNHQTDVRNSSHIASAVQETTLACPLSASIELTGLRAYRATESSSSAPLAPPGTGSALVSEETSKTVVPCMNTNDRGEASIAMAFSSQSIPSYTGSVGSQATVNEDHVDWMVAQLQKEGTEPPVVGHVVSLVNNFSFVKPCQSSASTLSTGAHSSPQSFYPDAQGDLWLASTRHFVTHPPQTWEPTRCTGGSKQVVHRPPRVSCASTSLSLQKATTHLRHYSTMYHKEAPRPLHTQNTSNEVMSSPVQPILPQPIASSSRTPFGHSTTANISRDAVLTSRLGKRKRADSIITTKGASSSGIRCLLSGCSNPGFEFASERELRKHQETAAAHRSSSPSCPLCHKELSRSDAVLRHLQYVHGGEKR